MKNILKRSSAVLIATAVMSTNGWITAFANATVRDKNIYVGTGNVLISTMGSGTLLYDDVGTIGVLDAADTIIELADMTGHDTHKENGYDLSAYTINGGVEISGGMCNITYISGTVGGISGGISTDTTVRKLSLKSAFSGTVSNFNDVTLATGIAFYASGITSGNIKLTPTVYTIGTQLLTNYIETTQSSLFIVSKEVGKGYTYKVDSKGKLAYADTTTIELTVEDKTYNAESQDVTGAIVKQNDAVVNNANVTYTYSDNETDFTDTAPVNVGTYFVKASLAEDATNGYHGCETIAQYKITKAALSVTANALTLKVGETIPTELSVVYSTFPNEVTKEDLDGTLVVVTNPTNTNTATTTGTVVPSGLSSNNFDITFVNGNVTIKSVEYSSSATKVGDWYTTDITITPTDSIYNYVKIGTSGTYGNTAIISTEGTQTVSLIFAKKNADNTYTALTPTNLTYKMDKTSPVINNVVATKNTGNKATVTITATDVASGIKDYSFDGGTIWTENNFKDYTTNQTIPANMIKVRDYAGHISTYPTDITITTIDNNAPTATYSPIVNSKVSLNGERVTVIFNEPVKVKDGTSLSVTGGTDATLDSDGFKLTFNTRITNDLNTTTTYTINNLEDLQGNAFVGSIYYTTVSQVSSRDVITTIPSSAVSSPTSYMPSTGGYNYKLDAVALGTTDMTNVIEHLSRKGINVNSSTIKTSYYDLSLLKQNGVDWNPANISSIVYLPYPSELNVNSNYTYTVYHFNNNSNNSPSTITPTVDGKGISFNTSSYSPFVLVAQYKNSSGSSEDSNYDQYQEEQDIFWNDLKSKMEDADDGDTIRVNAKGYEHCPASVLRELDGLDLTVIISWNGGKDIKIHGESVYTPTKTKVYYLMTDLYQMYKDGGKPIQTDKPVEVPVSSSVVPLPPVSSRPEMSLPQIPSKPQSSSEVSSTEPESSEPESSEPESSEPESSEPEPEPEEETKGGISAPVAIVAVVAVISLIIALGIFIYMKKKNSEISTDDEE